MPSGDTGDRAGDPFRRKQQGAANALLSAELLKRARAGSRNLETSERYKAATRIGREECPCSQCP
jgi:hypothetical protein